jgi:hypothetical protein
MSRPTTRQQTRHEEADALTRLARDLTHDEREFVLDNWLEAGTTTHALRGAFFTPPTLARDLHVEVSGRRIIDLGAGIGRLGWPITRTFSGDPAELVCVERDPEYARVGSKVLPEARWVVADLFDLPAELGRFDTAISNPPYGASKRTGDGPRYTGRRFEYHVADVAAGLADYGVFLIPQNSAPFRYSGRDRFEATGGDAEYRRFARETGLTLEMNCGIDTTYAETEWRGVSPRTEIVTCDLSEALTR